MVVTFDATAGLELIDQALADFATRTLIEQVVVQDCLLDIRLAVTGGPTQNG